MVNPLSITGYFEDLRQGGIEEPTAITYAKALGRFMGNEFASKSDIGQVRTELREHTNHLEGEINLVRSDLTTAINHQAVTLRAEMQAMELRLTIRLGAMIATGVGLLALLDALVK